ncbi:hypothetical protein FF80_00386 [Devosia sp. LC5]|nr:hypothetical protein FF80_00386 [Devosia sp. LC5]
MRNIIQEFQHLEDARIDMVDQGSVQIEQNNGWSRRILPQNLPSKQFRHETSANFSPLATKNSVSGIRRYRNSMTGILTERIISLVVLPMIRLRTLEWP